METAILKIVTDRPPPKIVAQAMSDPPPHVSIIRQAPKAIPADKGRYLDVDGILARRCRR